MTVLDLFLGLARTLAAHWTAVLENPGDLLENDFSYFRTEKHAKGYPCEADKKIREPSKPRLSV